MMKVLYERGLRLSKKKTRIGKTDKGFHFLGIHYPGTQPLDYINTPRSNDAFEKDCKNDLFCIGEHKSQNNQIDCKENVSSKFLPHSRTLRKARMQVNIMVFDGLSATRIKNYLHRWAMWWRQTAGIWDYNELLNWFICACFANNAATAVGRELQGEARIKVFLRPDYCSHMPQQEPRLFQMSLAVQ